MTQSAPRKKVANGLVALSSAAVLAVYSAGYLRTRPAADRFALQAAGRRQTAPVPPTAAAPTVDSPTVAPGIVAPSRVPPAHSSRKRETGVAPDPTPSPEVSSQMAEPLSAAVAPLPIATPPPPLPTAPVAAPAADPAAPLVEPKADEPAPAPAAPAQSAWKDGTYLGWGNSRHGSIQAAVVIEGGRIASATIAQCLTRYSCSVIDRLPPQVAQRQSPEVDYVSGATQSANAFYYAVVEALSKAK
jgi:uncharacterized protein with FMN-binding domain